MDWWVPYAVVAAALLISMIAPLPRSRRRRAVDGEAPRRATYNFKTLDDEDDLEPPRATSRPRPRQEETPPAPEPSRRAPPRAAPPPEPPSAQARRNPDEDALSAPQPTRKPPPVRAKPPPPPHRAAPGVNGRKPVTDRPGLDAPSYFRDPTALADWPQAGAVEETVRVFLDRWGGTKAGTTFRKVEVMPGSNERAFAFLLAVEPERRGKEATAILARVCVPGENAGQPSRFLATKYFDHMGERFREDVAKTPQHSRGIIMVRDVSGDDGRGAVALDFEVPLKGDPYDDIRTDDVAQYRNLLNIMRMFA
jgi:hypothetical protein